MEVEDENDNVIKRYLTCSVLKKNYIDDNSIILGYPIVRQRRNLIGNRIELYPIPEMLTYEGFLSEINSQQEKLDTYFDTKFKIGNDDYNCWMPVYLNKEHYEKNKTHVLNSFSVIKFGPEGKKEYDFKPEQIFEILPIILNKMIIGMFSGKSEISSAFIISYFQYVLLFKKLCEEFDEENMAFLNRKLSTIHENEYKIDKQIIPDLGDFLMILFYCNKDTHEEQMKKMWDTIFEEFIIRQMFWIFHHQENRDKIKKLVLKTRNNRTCMEKFEKEPNFKMRRLQQFNDDLNTKKLFDNVVNIISKDEKYLESLIAGQDNAEEQVKNTMNKNFKRLFTSCSEESQKEIKKIIHDNLNFADYFDYQDDNLYNDFKVSELLKDEDIENKDEIIEAAFDSQRGNKLLLITFFAQKKIEEEGFMEELEKNYGVYLEVDEFIKGMNQKLEEIKTFKQLLQYVGSDYGKDKTDLEIIIEAYDKAKEKNYINSTVAQNENNNYIGRGRRNNFIGRGWDNRGRGRGRGMGRGMDRGRGRGMDRGRGRGRGGGRERRRDFVYRGRGRRGRHFGGKRRGSRSRSRSRSDSN